jgi:hypothetical protein
VAVFSGTVPTSFTVKATLLDTNLALTSVNSSSNILTVAVGRPTQRSLSLSVLNRVIQGLNTDGVTNSVTLSMADRQGNPVPPGTQVNFVTEGGVMLPPVCYADANSRCSVQYRSQGTRPSSGRVSILAYVVGEEEFVDANGDNIYTCGEAFTDLGVAYRDDNGSSGLNGIYDLGEFQVPRGSAVNVCTGLPAAIAPGTGAGDGVWGAADVRAQTTLGLASDTAAIIGSITSNVVTVTISDAAFPGVNSVPTGSTVVASANVGNLGGALATCNINGPDTYTVGNTLNPTTVAFGFLCDPGDIIFVKVTTPTSNGASASSTTRTFTVP